MKKNLFLMGLLTLCMSFGLVSCGDDDNSSNDGGGNNHGVMTFVGTSTFYVVGMEADTKTTVPGDKVQMTLTGEGNKQASIVIPDMSYNYGGRDMNIKSFTANSGKEYTMTGSYQTGNMAFEWEEGEFATTTTGSDGNEKSVTGTIGAKYNHVTKQLDVVVEFKYGSMPFAINYAMIGDFQKN